MKLNDWKVLVVEDEDDSMAMVREMLEYHGIRTWGAPNAEDALQLLKKTTPTLIIIDLALPGMDGWSLLATIRRNETFIDIPCIAITAYHSAEVAVEAVEAGFDAYFAKPLDATSFVRELVGIVG